MHTPSTPYALTHPLYAHACSCPALVLAPSMQAQHSIRTHLPSVRTRLAQSAQLPSSCLAPTPSLLAPGPQCTHVHTDAEHSQHTRVALLLVRTCLALGTQMPAQLHRVLTALYHTPGSRSVHTRLVLCTHLPSSRNTDTFTAAQSTHYTHTWPLFSRLALGTHLPSSSLHSCAEYSQHTCVAFSRLLHTRLHSGVGYSVHTFPASLCPTLSTHLSRSLCALASGSWDTLWHTPSFSVFHQTIGSVEKQ